MSSIVWLASYPKSGNTWLRAFLANYFENPDKPVDINDLAKFGLADGLIAFYEKVSGRPFSALSPRELLALRPRVHRSFANSSPGSVLVKTHSALASVDGHPLITADVTAGAVYIVRNPLDVAVSLRYHYGLTMDRAVHAVCSEASALPPGPRFMFQILSSWRTHVASWTEEPRLARHVVRYEDMLAAPTRTFGGVLDFLETPRERARLKKAVRFSSFKVMTRQERQSGFIERSRHAERFFRKGAAGLWRQHLAPDHVDKIVAENRDVMQRLGYLSPEGEVLV